MIRTHRGKSGRFGRLLVALAALGLAIGVRPASSIRGRLALVPVGTFTTAGPASVEEEPVEPLGVSTAPSESDDDTPSLAAREEEGQDETSDEAMGLSWTQDGLFLRGERLRLRATPPPGSRSAWNLTRGASRPRRLPPASTLGSPPAGLPVSLCRLTC